MALSIKKPLRVLLFQLLFSFLVTMGLSFLSTVIDGDWRYFMPLKAAIFVLATLIVCLLIGLPIRLNTKINTWWTGHQLVSLIGTIVGILLLSLSYLPCFRESYIHYDMVIRNINIALPIAGWLLTTFCLLHWYPRPRTI
ncbi:MAG TPA: hypothetical protein VNS58_11845 [Puia sp.]|nr:hypothetical protein [Puia sp.]